MLHRCRGVCPSSTTSGSLTTLRRRTQSAGVPIPDADAGWAALRSWLSHRTLSPHDPLTLATFPDSGRGLMATKDIAEDDPIVEIPVELLVTVQTCDAFLEGALERAGWPLTEHGALALFLALNRHDRSGAWGPYVDMIPTGFDTLGINLPDALTTLLPPRATRHIARQRHNHDVDLSAALKFMPDLCKDDFSWAWCAVNTRCITLRAANPSSSTTPKGTPTIALAPFLDMLNHDPDAKVSTGLEDRDSVFRIRTRTGVSRGTEALISYGPHDNVFLLIEYGFCAPRNGFDSVDVELTLRDGPVKDEIQSRGFLGDYALRRDEECFRLLCALRRCCCETDAEVETWRKVGIYDERVSEGNEDRVRAMMRGMLEGKLEDLRRRLRGLEALVSSDDGRLRMAFPFVKNILQSHLEIVESQLGMIQVVV